MTFFSVGDHVRVYPSDSAAEIEDQTGHPGVVPGLRGAVVQTGITNVWDEEAYEVKLLEEPHTGVVLCFPGSELRREP